MRSSGCPIFTLFSTFTFSAGLTFVATTLGPGCQGVGRDLVTLFMQPDIDLDVPRDGLERLELSVDGRVSRCYDGDGLAVPPVPASGPRWMCAFDPRVADGYSVGIRFSATRATILGIGR